MTSRASTARTAFEAFASSILAWNQWIKDAVQFEQILKPNISWDRLNSNQKALISARLGASQPNQQPMLNALYISLASAFEEYLRSAVRTVAQKISLSGKSYVDLPEQLLKLNVRESAKLLRRMDSPPDYLNYDLSEICRSLGTCVPQATSVEINCDAMSEIEGLIRLDNCLSRLKDLGVSIDWDELGKEPLLKTALGLKNTAGARETTNLLKSTLGDIARFRNRIAHTGATASDVTDSVLLNHSSVMNNVMLAIDKRI